MSEEVSINSLNDLEKHTFRVFEFPMFSTSIYLIAKEEWGELHAEISRFFNCDFGAKSQDTNRGIAIRTATESKHVLIVIFSAQEVTLNNVVHELHHCVYYLNDILDDSLGEEAQSQILGYLVKECWFPFANRDEVSDE